MLILYIYHHNKVEKSFFIWSPSCTMRFHSSFDQTKSFRSEIFDGNQRVRLKENDSSSLKVKLHLTNISRSHNPYRCCFFSISLCFSFKRQVIFVDATTNLRLIFHKVNLAVNIVQIPCLSTPFRSSMISHFHRR